MAINNRSTNNAETQEKLVKTLSTLAAAQQPKDEFAGLLSSPNVAPGAIRMQELLASKREKQNEAVLENAAEEVLKLIEGADTAINSFRTDLAEARSRAVALKAGIESVAVARIYGERTMNWLPLAAAIGRANFVQATSDIDFSIPADQYAEILKEVKAKQAEKAAAKAAPAKRTRAAAAK
jgi:hypothetical protein